MTETTIEGRMAALRAVPLARAWSRNATHSCVARPASREGRRTGRPGAGATATAIALASTVVLVAASWVLSLRQMNGMDMGVATKLGSFASFTALWVAMMAAMMLPGSVPAVLRHAAARGRLRAIPLFMGSYLAVWALVGIATYALYRPHATLAAGIAVIAAGVYEVTPFKRYFRRRCRDSNASGLKFGLHCAGSSIGLMLVLVALGVMSVAWMSAIATLVLVQKLVPAHAGIDVPVALAIIGLGVLIVVSPWSVPGLVPTM